MVAADWRKRICPAGFLCIHGRVDGGVCLCARTWLICPWCGRIGIAFGSPECFQCLLRAGSADVRSAGVIRCGSHACFHSLDRPTILEISTCPGPSECSGAIYTLYLSLRVANSGNPVCTLVDRAAGSTQHGNVCSIECSDAPAVCTADRHRASPVKAVAAYWL